MLNSPQLFRHIASGGPTFSRSKHFSYLHIENRKLNYHGGAPPTPTTFWEVFFLGLSIIFG